MKRHVKNVGDVEVAFPTLAQSVHPGESAEVELPAGQALAWPLESDSPKSPTDADTKPAKPDAKVKE